MMGLSLETNPRLKVKSPRLDNLTVIHINNVKLYALGLLVEGEY